MKYLRRSQTITPASGFSNSVWWADRPDFTVALIIRNSLRGCDIYAAHEYKLFFLTIIAVGGIIEQCCEEIRESVGRK